MGECQGWFDGGSRGNPGLAGAGYCITCGREGSVYIGEHSTNNEAEYTGLLSLLVAAGKIEGLTKLEVHGDSKLVIMQVQRMWKCNKAHLVLLRDQCIQAIAGLAPAVVTLTHVPRAENKRADALANRAMDQRVTYHLRPPVGEKGE